jgi:hypothetical protein
MCRYALPGAVISPDYWVRILEFRGGLMTSPSPDRSSCSRSVGQLSARRGHPWLGASRSASGSSTDSCPVDRAHRRPQESFWRGGEAFWSLGCPARHQALRPTMTTPFQVRVSRQYVHTEVSQSLTGLWSICTAWWRVPPTGRAWRAESAMSKEAVK